MDPETRTSKQELLQKLRDENAEQWERLRALHHQHRLDDDAAKQGPASASRNMVNLLQAEIDCLPENELARESTRMLHRLLSPDNRETGEETMDEEDCQRYAQEVVESFYQLQQTNAVLQQSIHRERSRLEKLQTWSTQHEHVQETLQAEQRERQQSDAVPEPSEQEQHAENQRLGDDLAYVAQCIQSRRETIRSRGPPAVQVPTATATTATARWSLDRLVIELMTKRLDLSSTEEDHYLLVDDHPIDPQHVELLHDSHMLETFQGDPNLIKLIDYL